MNLIFKGIIALFFFTTLLSAQQLQHAYISGDLNAASNAVYGTQGVVSNGLPESLAGQCIWKVGDTVYMFGGEVFGSYESSGSSTQFTNRLWSWDSKNGWQWLMGDTANCENGVLPPNSMMSYGLKGQASATNLPGPRMGAAYATGINGELYMYGGLGVAENGYGALEDLWKYHNGQWTWLSGSKNTSTFASAQFTQIGSSGNNPGGLVHANMWVDLNEDLWLFGGLADYDFLTTVDGRNSVFRFNGNDWDWMAGSSQQNQGATASGSPAVYTGPSARECAAGVYASDGKFYLFGGYHTDGTRGAANDFWSWDGNTWTLINGDPTHSGLTNNSVTARYLTSMAEINGDLYLFGGKIGYGVAGTNEINIYNGVSWSPTLIGQGSPSKATPGFYSNICPDSPFEFGYQLVSDGEEIYVYGGNRMNSSFLAWEGNENWFMKTNGQSWAFLSGGAETDAYSPGGIITTPGSRYGATSYFDQNSEILYLFGGHGYGEGSSTIGKQNDLWKYEAGNWVWLSGSKSINQVGVYGLKGQSDPLNVPGARSFSHLWLDKAGVLWLFGGDGLAETSTSGKLNDLWKFENGHWTWVHGGNAIAQLPVTSGAANLVTPGSKRRGVLHVDTSNGEAYLFGGYSKTSAGSDALTNDFWKWDGTNWTYLSTNSLVQENEAGNYGTKGQYSTTNVPGARTSMASVSDGLGFFIFGGYGYLPGNLQSNLDQLWYFDFSSQQWVWLEGTQSANISPVYNDATKNDPACTPGGRQSAMMWHNDGSVYLYGGLVGANSSNDFWQWDGANWAWLKGGKAVSANSIAQSGSSNKAKFRYLPSGRNSGVYWQASNHFYIYGGQGYNSTSVLKFLGDFWVGDLGFVWDGTAWDPRTPNGISDNSQIISNTSPQLSTQFGDLLVDADVEFDADDNAIFVAGDYHSNGYTTKLGDLTFNGPETQYLTGKELATYNRVIVNSGVVLETGDSLRLKASDRYNYGEIYNQGTVNGEIEFEYYVVLDEAVDNGRYVQFGSVLDNVEIRDFNQGGILNTGNSDPTVNTVWQWDAASSIWSSPVNSVANPGSAFSVYAGNRNSNNFIFQDGTKPGVINIRGTLPNTNTITVPFYYDDGQNTSVVFVGGTSQAATEGWNLVANPYPFNLDMVSILSNYSALNIKPSIYQWRGSNYASYNDFSGVAVNGGKSTMAPGQGFFFQASTQSGGSLDFTKSQFISNNTTNVYLFKSKARPVGIMASVWDTLGQIDEAWLGFNAQATSHFDSKFDAWNLQVYGLKADLSFPSPQGNLSISSMNQDSVSSVPLGFEGGHNTNLQFKFKLADLTGFSQVYLEDKKLDLLQDLFSDTTYSFVVDSNYSDRFVLHFSRLGGVSLPDSKDLQAVYYYQDQSGVFLAAQANTSANYKVNIFSSGGQLIEECYWFSKEPLQVLRTAAPGLYMIDLVEDATGGKTSLKLVKGSR